MAGDVWIVWFGSLVSSLSMWEMPSGRAYGAASAPAECIRLRSLSFVGGGSGAMGLCGTWLWLRMYLDFSQKAKDVWTVNMHGCIGANICKYVLVDFEMLPLRPQNGGTKPWLKLRRTLFCGTTWAAGRKQIRFRKFGIHCTCGWKMIEVKGIQCNIWPLRLVEALLVCFWAMLQEPARPCWWRCGMQSSWPRAREGWNNGWELMVMTVMRCGEYVSKCVFWIFACVSWLCLLFWHFSSQVCWFVCFRSISQNIKFWCVQLCSTLC